MKITDPLAGHLKPRPGKGVLSKYNYCPRCGWEENHIRNWGNPCQKVQRFSISDTKRLNWFEKNQGFQVKNRGTRSWIFHGSIAGGTLRQEIDSYIRAERKARRGGKA